LALAALALVVFGAYDSYPVESTEINCRLNPLKQSATLIGLATKVATLEEKNATFKINSS